jgi:EmrB/QacA subfamily drug resistance transporter
MSASTDRRYVLLVAALASFLSSSIASAVVIALPTIGREFNSGAVVLAWIRSGYLLATAVTLLTVGRLADIHGRRRVFVWGIATFTAASLLCAVAPSAAFLIAFRVLQGVGGAMIFSTAAALVTSAYPLEKRGTALGLNVAGVYTGLSLGPVLGGLLTEHLGWRSLFFLDVPLGVLILGIVLWRVRQEWVAFRGERFDVHGALIYGIGMIALMLGFTELPELHGLFLLLGGLGALAGFAAWELRAPTPLFDLRIFRRNRTFGFSSLAALINYTATAAVAFLLSLYLQYNRGFSAETAGLILIAQPVLQTVFSPLAGRLSDHVQPRVLVSVGMTMIVGSLSLFAFLGPNTPLGLIIGNLAWLGLSFALFSSPNTNAMMSAVDRRFYGVAAGTVATMRTIGQMTSMGVTMLLIALLVGNVTITSANAGHFLFAARVVFGLSAALCVLGVMASLARGDLARGSPDSNSR